MNEQYKEGRTALKIDSSWIWLAGQLLAAFAVAHIYDLERDMYLRDLILLTGLALGFQLTLPSKWWPVALLLLSLVGLVWFAGPINALATTITGMGIILLATCQRSVIRYTSLILVFSTLVFLYLTLPSWLQPFTSSLTLVGVIFMYRLPLFLYEREQSTHISFGVTDTTYFFLLPNMAMTLFPAVDYHLFRQQVPTDQRLAVWKKGVYWVVTGIFHLVVYRFIYHILLLPAEEVKDLLGFARYSFFNYTMIIRLSGLFHIAVGILCLLGFDLPRVFHHYFLATGFSDLWRRINIYFRDFLVKVFYYPIYFRLRHWGNARAIPASILILFVITWFLHAVQWFWIKGQFPLRIQDIIFWGVFGILVASSAWWDITFRTAKHQPVKPIQAAGFKVARIIGMLIFMSILWSLWTAPSLEDWWLRARTGMQAPGWQFGILSLVIIGLWITGVVIWQIILHFRLSRLLDPEPSSLTATIWSVSILTILLSFSLIAPSLKGIRGSSMSGILTEKLNDADEVRRIEGYYNDILTGHQLSDPLARQKNLLIDQDGELRMYSNDFRHIKNKPDIQVNFKGKTFSTNEWGMRNDPFPQQKPKGTFRILLMGGSIVMGSGVADDEVFDRHLERIINGNKATVQYQFMNSGTSTYDLIDCILQFESEEYHRFDPDMLMLFTHGLDGTKTIHDMAKNYKNGVRMPYLFMDIIIHRSGLRREMNEKEMVLLLQPYTQEILKDGYRKLKELCESHKIKPVWVYWPPLARAEAALEEKEISKQIVKDLGYAIIDLESLYSHLDPETLTVSRYDMHPNAYAHALMADTLAKVLVQRSLLPNPQ